MAKGCALSTGYLPRGGLPRNSVDRITDRSDMTAAVDRGRKASTQTNKKTDSGLSAFHMTFSFLKPEHVAFYFALLLLLLLEKISFNFPYCSLQLSE